MFLVKLFLVYTATIYKKKRKKKRKKKKKKEIKREKKKEREKKRVDGRNVLLVNVGNQI